jgi:hypothetical protein
MMATRRIGNRAGRRATRSERTAMTERDPIIISRLAEMRQADLLATMQARREPQIFARLRRAIGRLLVRLGSALAGDGRGALPPVRSAAPTR